MSCPTCGSLVEPLTHVELSGGGNAETHCKCPECQSTWISRQVVSSAVEPLQPALPPPAPKPDQPLDVMSALRERHAWLTNELQRLSGLKDELRAVNRMIRAGEAARRNSASKRKD